MPTGLLVLALCGCGESTAPQERQAGEHNILILLVDDIGVDVLSAFQRGEPGEDRSPLPRTPTINGLARAGVSFRNVWANPLCSPTRATIQTGRYSFRTGLGAVVNPQSAALDLSEITLPEMLELGRPGIYSTAAIGKWHLGNESVGGLESPRMAGYSHFAGALSNLVGDYSYESWEKVTDGALSPSEIYATTDVVDSALDWIDATAEPWLCYAAFHAAHLPLHAPPAHLHEVDLSDSGAPDDAPWDHYRAMVEALDRELGRLLAGLGSDRLERTTVVFLADNGTSPLALGPGADGTRGKGTLFEGGVRVPLIVQGPLVKSPGRPCNALVNTTDLFATVAELAQVDLESALPGEVVLDSVSLVPYLVDSEQRPLRQSVYAEHFRPNGFNPDFRRQAIRSRRWKLVRESPPLVESLFDLLQDPGETRNLLSGADLPEEARRGYERMNAELAQLADGSR